MGPKIRLFPNFGPFFLSGLTYTMVMINATLRRTALIAAAVAALALPAAAEQATLVCQAQGGVSFTLRIDYDRKIVDMPNSADLSYAIGTAFYNTTATFNEGAIAWDTVIESRGATFRGSVNRLTGEAFVTFSEFYNDGREMLRTLSGPCQRAQRKF